MLNVRIVCVGKIKDSFNKQGIDEYKKRLSRYIKLDIIEVDDGKQKYQVVKFVFHKKSSDYFIFFNVILSLLFKIVNSEGSLYAKVVF